MSENRNPAPGNLPAPRTSIFLTWLPLAFMWFLMAFEQPIIALVVARMDEAILQLAAFGITFALALFIEGPVIQMLAAGTALADSRENYRRIMGIMHLIGWGATLIHGVLCIPGIFDPFARTVLGIDEQLIRPARLALLSMLPWTLAVGYRRLWQGVLIRYDRTRVIPVSMVARLTASVLVLVWGFRSRALPGAVLGGTALSVGVIVGAVVAWLYAAPVVRRMPRIKDADPAESVSAGSSRTTSAAGVRLMSWASMFAFYIPLALTNFLNLGARPVMQMGLARGPLPMESLAVWPVSMGFLFLFTSLSLSSQEVVIARLDGPESRRRLLRFNSWLAVGLSSIYLVVLLTPLLNLWLSGVSGLDAELAALARSPLVLAFPVIPVSAFLSLLRGALVRQRRTAEVTLGIAINVAVLLGTLFAGVALLPYPAISTVSASYALAFVVELLFLLSRRPLKEFK